MPEFNLPTLRRALRAMWAPPMAATLVTAPLLAAALLAAPLLVGASLAAAQPSGGNPAAAPAAPATPPAKAETAPAAPASTVPTVTDTAAPPAPASTATASPNSAQPATAPDASAPAGKTHAVRHPGHAHRRASAGTSQAEDSTDATVALTTQPGSELETTATRLVASDLRQSRSAGDPPVMLVGSARLGVKPGPAALFVQVQSADFCGSAGCSTSAYLRNGDNWTKVLDSISGPIKVSRRSHHGMYDLLVHGKDRWVWNGHAYADTLPSPDVDLLHSVKK